MKRSFILALCLFQLSGVPKAVGAEERKYIVDVTPVVFGDSSGELASDLPHYEEVLKGAKKILEWPEVYDEPTGATSTVNSDIRFNLLGLKAAVSSEYANLSNEDVTTLKTALVAANKTLPPWTIRIFFARQTDSNLFANFHNVFYKSFLGGPRDSGLVMNLFLAYSPEGANIEDSSLVVARGVAELLGVRQNKVVPRHLCAQPLAGMGPLLTMVDVQTMRNIVGGPVGIGYWTPKIEKMEVTPGRTILDITAMIPKIRMYEIQISEDLLHWRKAWAGKLLEESFSMPISTSGASRLYFRIEVKPMEEDADN